MANLLQKPVRLHSFGLPRRSPSRISPPAHCHFHSQTQGPQQYLSRNCTARRTVGTCLQGVARFSPELVSCNGALAAAVGRRQLTTPSADGRRDVVGSANRLNRPDGSPFPQKRDVFRKQWTRPQQPQPKSVTILIDGQQFSFSPLFLRDLCDCPQCVDPSTRQKLFSTTDIPRDIQASVEYEDGGHTVSLTWSNDIGAAGREHISRFGIQMLKHCAEWGRVRSLPQAPLQNPWTNQDIRREVEDTDYEAYMSDDRVLLRVLRQLWSHGLVFLTGVPESSESVARIGERIGPLKNTFYGLTWDVRSVPEAKNVAYTAQNLDFHMDLMYISEPPQFQLLHCIRSSSVGGASLFTDGFRAAVDLYGEDLDAFNQLSRLVVRFHYNHPGLQHYAQPLKVIEMSTRFDPQVLKFRPPHSDSEEAASKIVEKKKRLANFIRAISWSPPFQAPFTSTRFPRNGRSRLDGLNYAVDMWHAAATKFDALLHRPDGIYERMMKPGECVIFDNRRVLHARRAFEVADAGKERWLRGAYLDRDAFFSKIFVLGEQFADDDSAVMPEDEAGEAER